MNYDPYGNLIIDNEALQILISRLKQPEPMTLLLCENPQKPDWMYDCFKLERFKDE